MSGARDFGGVAVACPVTIPYVRHSDRPAHWFIGTALRGLLDASGLDKAAVDGLAVSSFSLGSDTTIALTEHFDMAPRWIDCRPATRQRRSWAIISGNSSRTSS